MAAGSESGLSEEAAALSVGSLWKGENDSDAEQMEAYDSNPLADAGAWSEDEAYTIYREKLVRLRSLYSSQLTRLKHSLAERRREFLMEWTAAGGDREEAINPSRGGTLEDSAYRSYRRRSGEEAVLERRQKQRQIAASVEFFSRKDMRNSSRAHYQHLMRLQGQHSPSPYPPCGNINCDNKCLPFATKCRRHICEDPKQLLYTSCMYVYPSGAQCTSPVSVYLNPPLCGGHCDTVIIERSSTAAPPTATPSSGTVKDSHIAGEVDTSPSIAAETPSEMDSSKPESEGRLERGGEAEGGEADGVAVAVGTQLQRGDDGGGGEAMEGEEGGGGEGETQTKQAQ